MHAGVFWVSTVRGIYGPFLGKFLPLGSFGRAGSRSGLQHSSLVHPRHDQGFQDRSVPQGLLHSYWPWQVSPMRCSRVTGLFGNPGWWAGPSVSLSKQATSLMYSTHQLALANHGLCWKFWKFFKTQLSNRCSHRCWLQWHSRSFNSGGGAVEKQCLSVLHQNSLCGRSISFSDAGVIGLCLPRWSS